MERYRVVQHLVRKPWKSQEVGVEEGAGFYKYRVVKNLVIEPKRAWRLE